MSGGSAIDQVSRSGGARPLERIPGARKAATDHPARRGGRDRSEHGLSDDNTKMAYLEDRFVLRAPLPTGPAKVGPLPGDLGGGCIPPVAHDGAVTRARGPTAGRPRGASGDCNLRDRPRTETASGVAVLIQTCRKAGVGAGARGRGPVHASAAATTRPERDRKLNRRLRHDRPLGNRDHDHVHRRPARRRALRRTLFSECRPQPSRHRLHHSRRSRPPTPPGTICTAVGYARRVILYLANPLFAESAHLEQRRRRDPRHAVDLRWVRTGGPLDSLRPPLRNRRTGASRRARVRPGGGRPVVSAWALIISRRANRTGTRRLRGCWWGSSRPLPSAFIT